jgi:Tfp pilus assembly protein PilO
VSKLTERQRLIVTIAVTVLVVGGLVAAIMKDRGEIEETETEISSLESRIQAAEIEIRKTKSREDKVLIYRAVEERELAVLPTEQEIANFHRDLSLFLQQAGLYFHDLPESTPVESGLASGIFVTRTVLSCEGDAAALLRFINMIENDERLVAVKGLKVRQSRNRRKVALGEDDAPLHEIEIHLETYFYSLDARGKPRIKIPGEEARLQDPEITDAITAFQPERPDTYVLRPSTSRRDPLVDPRKPRAVIDPAEYEEMFQREEAIVLDLENRVDDLLEKAEQARAQLQLGALFKHDHMDREVETGLNDIVSRLSHADQMKRITIPELLARTETIRARLEDVQSSRTPRSSTVTKSVAEEMLAELSTAFDNGEYQEVLSLVSQWLIFMDGKEIDDDARPAIASISELRPRARTYADFHSIPLRVTGTIVNPVDPSQSVAVINGRAWRAGDVIDDSGAVVVGHILRDGVDFRFKGETIRVNRHGASVSRKPAAPDKTGTAMHPVGARAPASLPTSR